jgi:Putative prokaryotic signal transducing protein
VKRVYTAKHAWDAQMVRDILAANGIDATVQQATTGLHHLERGSVHLMKEEDEAAAAELIREFDAGLRERRDDDRVVWPWRCRCGEDVEPQFSACWNCGQERPQPD